MTYVVTEHCVKCKYTDCVESCPVAAFHEGEDMLYINPQTCIDCEACVEFCPVDAIYADKDLPSGYKNYLEINAVGCETSPVITEVKPPLAGALTREDWQTRDKGRTDLI